MGIAVIIAVVWINGLLWNVLTVGSRLSVSVKRKWNFPKTYFGRINNNKKNICCFLFSLPLTKEYPMGNANFLAVLLRFTFMKYNSIQEIWTIANVVFLQSVMYKMNEMYSHLLSRRYISKEERLMFTRGITRYYVHAYLHSKRNVNQIKLAIVW